MENEDLMLVSQSKYDFNQTIIILQEDLVAGKWKIPIIHDLSETVKKRGYDVLPVKIIEVCKPEYASFFLNNDALRVYSSLMPCRISVYQTSDGGVFISRMNASSLKKFLDPEVIEGMENAFNEIEGILSRIISL